MFKRSILKITAKGYRKKHCREPLYFKSCNFSIIDHDFDQKIIYFFTDATVNEYMLPSESSYLARAFLNNSHGG